MASLAEDLRYLDARTGELDEELAVIVRETPAAQRLLALPGVGPRIATALVGALGSGETHARVRGFAISIGLTPRYHGTGGKQRMLRSASAATPICALCWSTARARRSAPPKARPTR